ncbi:MAG: PRC-barrel domain-containing protein, partial [Coriobacteriales bacterium]|nr:PRC-barrel domain-containing protein [Coriobacteriales bacterium]
MTEKLTSIKKLTGTRVIKGKKIPRTIGKVSAVVFHPSESRVVGFITKRMDLLLMIKRKKHFVSAKSYYMYEDYLFARPQKGSLNKSAYKALGLNPADTVQWLGLPVVSENGQTLGTVCDVSFVHQSGEVCSIETSLGSVGKLVQGTRTIPAALIKGYSNDASATLALTNTEGVPGGRSKRSAALVVSNEALGISVDTEKGLVAKTGRQVSSIASKAGVDTAAVSEKAKAAAEVAGVLANKGAQATGKQLKKTRGMFSDFM